MIQYGLEWHALDTYFQMVEVASAPGTPEANNIRQYASDASGASTVCWKNDAGFELCLPTSGSFSGGAIGGSGSANAIAFWTGVSSLDDEAAWTFNITTHALTLNAAGQHTGLTMLSGGATNRSNLNLGRTAFDGGLSIAGGVGENSDIVLGAGELVVRSSTSHLVLTARSASGEIKFATGAADTLKAVLKSDGDLIIGATATPWTATAGRGGAVVRSTSLAEWNLFNFGTAGFQAGLRMGGARGTFAVPTASLADDASFVSGGHFDGTNWATGALIGLKLGENWGATARGTYITLETTPLLSTTRAERFRVGPAGQWGIGGANYGTARQVNQSNGALAAPVWANNFGEQLAVMLGGM